ncbi:hypothetical protein, partial [Klebsiella aerogenes]|uniref:hypothetical protein n=1 Tax=Klebsiella aerogenes TaxID=548 RepID=UPI001CC728BD
TSAPLPEPIKIVGMGSACVDYLAQVAAYPQPDDKLRTERLEVQGGGNCGNALTAAESSNEANDSRNAAGLAEEKVSVQVAN